MNTIPKEHQEHYKKMLELYRELGRLEGVVIRLYNLMKYYEAGDNLRDFPSSMKSVHDSMKITKIYAWCQEQEAKVKAERKKIEAEENANA